MEHFGTKSTLTLLLLLKTKEIVMTTKKDLNRMTKWSNSKLEQKLAIVRAQMPLAKTEKQLVRLQQFEQGYISAILLKNF